MKSIKKDDVIKRVSDSTSESYIKAGWSYVSKSEWKKSRPVKSEKKSEKKIMEKK